MPRRVAVAAALALVAFAAPARAHAGAVIAEDSPARLVLRTAQLQVAVDRSPWRLTLTDAGGTPLVTEADPARPDPVTNPDYAIDHDTDQGIDAAYPGLPSVSYRPLGYLRGGAWQGVTALRSWSLAGRTATLGVIGSDGARAHVRLIFGAGTVRLQFDAPAGTTAVEEAWAADPAQRYVGGGQRFAGVDQTGRSVPLWVSHGVGSDRGYSTNEVAIPLLWSTGGWGFWSRDAARGEINVAVPGERPDALDVVHEDDHLDLELLTGEPASILREYRDVAGASEVPPDWALRPMYWQDSDITWDAITAEVSRLRDAGIPLGAYWIDNPWETHRGDFTPNGSLDDPAHGKSFEQLIATLNAQGVHVMAWGSPFFSAATTPAEYRLQGDGVGGDDATYLPPRGLEAHLDLTDPAAAQHLVDRAAALLERGIDGFKLDRGEEDLGDDTVWSNGLPNRLNHNAYVLRYDQAMRQACVQAGKPDCFIIARGGVAGTQRYAANWAADNPTGPGPTGLGQALNSLLSLSLSGQPVSGSDIGGYVGTRKDVGGPVGTPTVGTYARWTALGAFSPIMESANDPTTFQDPTAGPVVAVARRFATIHDRLAPYAARWLRVARDTGLPLVRPLLLAFPADPVAVRTDDEYLYGPDVLVAPIVDPVSDTGPDPRAVYLPAGTWTDAWTGASYTGPTIVPTVSPIDQIPVFLRRGGSVSRAVFNGV